MAANCAVAAPQQSPKPALIPSQPGPAVSASAQWRQSVTVLLREPVGSQLGSGVLVGSGLGGYWVVTNRHVVQQQATVCVVTADRRETSALVLPAPKDQRGGELDLALLWLPRSSKEPLNVVTMKPKPADQEILPLVRATGYPTPLQPPPDGPMYTESPGLLVPLLKSSLQGGFDLVYTAPVQKGMSGGGVFVGRELIGINGAHANPLWPGQWRDQRGEAVDEQLNEKLELVSLGMSSTTITNTLMTLSIPGPGRVKDLATINCQSGMNETPAVRTPSKDLH